MDEASLSHRSSSRRINWSSSSLSSRNLFAATGQLRFDRSGREYDDEEELKWAAIERLPRTRKAISNRVVDEEIDFADAGLRRERVVRIFEEDNEKFLKRIRKRADKVGMERPKVEVRFENLSIEGDAYVGSRALPTLLNSTLNIIEGVLEQLRILPSKKRSIKILHDVSGIIKPSRLTLLLGPPGSGKSVFLKSLAAKLDKDLTVSGRITYCGHEFSEFVPQRTCAYVSQHDVHHGEMTARETMNFSARCLGIETRYRFLTELSRREKEAGIKPDPEIDAYVKALREGRDSNGLVTDYVIKLLGLDICADILVGDEMRRGISGGQKKRLTTGEILAGPARFLCMDEISTGLDSSTTYQIVNYMRHMVHTTDATMIVSLLQPTPETFDLFDDIILLSEGRIVYQGPRDTVLQFFEGLGFKCPQRKCVADFLQEVTSVKDQEQYWCKKDRPYRYVSASEFVDQFSSFPTGQSLYDELAVPYDKERAHPAALVTERYGISNWELFKACLSREWLLIKRNALLYVFKVIQITLMSIVAFTVFFRSEMEPGSLMGGAKFYGALFFGLVTVMFNGTSELALTVLRLPVFFKQRDALFYPPWAFSLPIWLLRIPLCFVESFIWVILTYYTIGYAPQPTRFFRQFLAFFALQQMSLALLRFISVIARTLVVACCLGTSTLLLVFVLGGFIIAKDDLPPWMIWGYYISPMTYGQNAIAINEFLDERWSTPNTDPRYPEPTVGRVLLRTRGMFTDENMYWVCIAALFAFSILFHICFTVALTYLNPYGDPKSVITDENEENESTGEKKVSSMDEEVKKISKVDSAVKKGMVLPFTPLSLSFDNVNYYVDMPADMKKRGIQEDKLQLLRNVSGAFRPGVLTALVGESGAGKTTLMDVLAGRKTGGYVEGNINISGYPKNQTTFARICGYCEQTDIHSPHVTVYESISYSALLRLSSEVNEETRKMFIEEVMELIELQPLRNALVGMPGVSGLSTEQRKRLTIAVELVANPSIIFMDEPTSGLDARAAAIVMRTVRNTVDTGRTVVCTIHQPSIDIFEAFDELMLLKRGGQVIYAGSLGHQSGHLIKYFEAVAGIPKIREGQNPATWMLDITTPAVEALLKIDFAEIYANSDMHRKNQELVKRFSYPEEGSKDIQFPTKYAQSFFIQCRACLWKHNLSYWRNPLYNSIRFFTTIGVGLVFGAIFWKKGNQISKLQDLMNLLGGMYSAVVFLGGMNACAAQAVVDVERTVYYREKATGMYSALPYAFAQVGIETIYVGIQTLIYSLLLYSMIGFEWTAEKFLWFYFFIFMCFIYFTAYGMMLVSLTPNYQIAAVILSFFLSCWNLFSGFLIPRTQIPIWWRWYYWSSPVSWTIYGLITSQIGGKTNPVELPGFGSVALNDFLEVYLGFRYDFLGIVSVVHVLWGIFFCVMFALGIKFLNFQKR